MLSLNLPNGPKHRGSFFKKYGYLQLILNLNFNFNFMAPFYYGWVSTASRLQPLQGGSLIFTIQFPEIPGTHLHALLDEMNTGMLHFTKKWNWWLSNIKHTFTESFQKKLSVLHQSICIFNGDVSSLSDGWAKYKEKVTEMSDFNQNVETTCNSKLKFVEFSDELKFI